MHHATQSCEANKIGYSKKKFHINVVCLSPLSLLVLQLQKLCKSYPLHQVCYSMWIFSNLKTLQQMSWLYKCWTNANASQGSHITQSSHIKFITRTNNICLNLDEKCLFRSQFIQYCGRKKQEAVLSSVNPLMTLLIVIPLFLSWCENP